MPRGKRLQVPGAIYHIISRGIERRSIYLDDADREEFLKRLSEGLEKSGSQCLGWTLMSNHFHLLIRTGETSLSELIKRLLTGYAVYFNRRHGRSGYLYQNRYKSILCQEERYLLSLVQYIHLNPVRAKIVKDIIGLDHYKWTGHSVLMGKQQREWQEVDEILSRFGETKNKAKVEYRKYIETAMNMGKQDELTGGGLRRSAGGWEGVKILKQRGEYWRGDERILGDGDFVKEVLDAADESMKAREKMHRDGWNLEQLEDRVCTLFGAEKNDLHKSNRCNKASEARSLIAYWGYTKLGIKGTELASHFGISKQAISNAVKRGEKLAAKNNYTLIS